MSNPITTIEFRFDQEHFHKDGMLFQGPMSLLAIPEPGECFDLDRPAGSRGQVIRKEIKTAGRFTEVIVHCRLENAPPALRPALNAEGLFERVKMFLKWH